MPRDRYLSEVLGKKPKKSDEDRLQMSLVDYLRWAGRKDVLFWHTPNGGARSKATAGKLKGMGVLPGVPDLIFLFPDATIACLELKIPGGTVSPAQTAFIEHCERIGVMAAVAYGFDQAVEVLTAWGVLKSVAT